MSGLKIFSLLLRKTERHRKSLRCHCAVAQAILANKHAHLEKIRELFGKLNDDDGIITYNAFEDKIHSPDVREYFESLGLDVSGFHFSPYVYYCVSIQSC